MRSRARTFICGVVEAAALALPGAASAADFGIEDFSIATTTQQAGALAFRLRVADVGNAVTNQTLTMRAKR